MCYKNVVNRLVVFLSLYVSLAFGSNPDIITNLTFNGDPANSTVANLPVVVKFRYSADSGAGVNDGNFPNVDVLAKAKDVGSVWGMAYAPKNKKLYVSTVVRRHVGIKGSTGDIYLIDLLNNSVSKFITVPNSGTVLSNSARGLGDKNSPSHDPLFSEIGKIGLGDIDISADESTLYVINLNDQSLYKVDISTKNVTKISSIGDPFNGCSDVRPWALKVTQDSVYVGSTCANDLRKGAAISKLTGAGFTTVATMDMSYSREIASFSTSTSVNHHWNVWSDTVTDIFNGGDYPDYPQPILSDIEIDDDGSFILGFLDRSSLEGGHKNYSPDTTDSVLYYVMSGGDIRRICKVGSKYISEGQTGCEYHTSGEGNKVEYYIGDYYARNKTANRKHREIALGGLALLKGTGEVLSSTYDPYMGDDVDYTYTGGVRVLDNSTGDYKRGKVLYSAKDAAEGRARMGKAGGVGDVELLEAPPKTACLGDLVWEDVNRDGLQNSWEPKIDSVEVNLLSSDGTTQIKSTITQNGLYSFCQLLPNSYYIEFIKPTDYEFTKKGSGREDDSDANIANGKTDKITLGSSNDYSWDAGLYQPLSCPIGYKIYEISKNGGKRLYYGGETLIDISSIFGTDLAKPFDIDIKNAVTWDGYDNRKDTTGQTKESVRVVFKDKKDASLKVTPYTTDIEDGINYDKKITDLGNVNVPNGASKAYIAHISNDIYGSSEHSSPNSVVFSGFCYKFNKHTSNPKIDLEKYTNNKDADIATGPYIKGGDSVIWTYVVKNIGNVKLTNVTVTDNPTQTITCPKTELNPNEEMNCTATGIAKVGQYENIATVKGTAPSGDDVNDTDPSHYFGVDAKIDIDKATNGQDADDANGTDVPKLIKGQNVTWNYFVKNIGNVRLSNIVVTDNIEGVISCPKTILEPNESMNCIKKGVAKVGDYENSATVKGSSLDINKSVTDTDLSHYKGIEGACIGDKIWEDLNANGIQDSGEDGVAGVELELLDSLDNRVKDAYGNVVASITTQKDGNYSFCNLLPGVYKVKIIKLPDGYFITRSNRGLDDTKDSDVDAFLKTSGDMPQEYLSSGENNRTFDAGVFKSVCLCGEAWIDSNVNGIKESTEEPLANVKVTLKSASGDSNITDVYGKRVESVYTKSDGSYTFCGLIPGEYRLDFEKKPNANGKVYLTTKSGKDSKVPEFKNGGGESDSFILKSGDSCNSTKNNLKVAVGFIEELCLGDYVWFDENLNGIQDSGEPGVIDVPVYIKDANGNIVKDIYGEAVVSTKTDSRGYYKFCHLRPAQDYVIKFKVPDSYHPTLMNRGSDLKDSDADENGEVTVVGPTKDDLTIDLGIYCECDDYLVHPERFKELRMPSLSIIGLIAMIFSIFIIVKRGE